ncbi:MAG: hypothetical protein LWX56_08970 [Ignavibacteria bacterium]|nr:hypothetical protein [Ignavibacteria bacterium]
MKKLSPPISGINIKGYNVFESILNDKIDNSQTKEIIIAQCLRNTITYDQYNFYPLISRLFQYLGFNCITSRTGDTNNRMDAILVDDFQSIPIEIKSPTEIGYINIKSIQQATENKVVLLSRKFYPTLKSTSTLVVGYEYPPTRSDVIELIEDISITYNINVGVIDLFTLLTLAWNTFYLKEFFDKNRIFTLRGCLSL